jgi:hypothetical protein
VKIVISISLLCPPDISSLQGYDSHLSAHIQRASDIKITIFFVLAAQNCAMLKKRHRQQLMPENGSEWKRRRVYAGSGLPHLTVKTIKRRL